MVKNTDNFYVRNECGAKRDECQEDEDLIQLILKKRRIKIEFEARTPRRTRTPMNESLDTEYGLDGEILSP